MKNPKKYNWIDRNRYLIDGIIGWFVILAAMYGIVRLIAG